MIEITQTHLESKAARHSGMSGKQNEDRYRVCHCQKSPKDKTLSTLAVLCDGIGGHRAGEVAAQMGVSIITETIFESDAKKPLEVMEKAIFRASDAIYQMSQSDHGHSGMGTTCAITWIIGSRLYTANLGDSRIYLLRDGHIAQLTTDHTWVQEAYEAGLINESEKATHPNAHVLRRYLGAKEAPMPDFRMWYFEGESDLEALENQGKRLKAGDILLLCSDGLTDLVGDHEIQEVIQNNTLDAAIIKLIQMSNERGGHDNVTLILLEVPSKGVFKKSGKRRIFLGCLFSIIALSAMVTAFLFGQHWLKNRNHDITIQTPKPAVTLPTQSDNIQSSKTPLLRRTRTPTNDMTTDIVTQQPSITPWPTNTTAQ